MLVSKNWLTEYVSMDMEQQALEDCLSMSGLNHEGTEPVGDDLAIDLEVTSNRPDCLGHIGVAREIAVLYDQPLSIPDPQPTADGSDAGDSISVNIQCPELCSHYTARVIRGVKVGPSPDWLVRRLETIFKPLNPQWEPVNNVVDITNYVLMECGQPLHAFDLAQITGNTITVRSAAADEEFEAIDHHTYKLQPGMCVIADDAGSIAIGGVMGGAESEVSESTVDVLIESAVFDPLATRSTSRALNLFSPSSYRFERGMDPEGVDWASRRCCELILEICGGTLEQGLVCAGEKAQAPSPVTLRLNQIDRILGISVEEEQVKRILIELGNEILSADESQVEVVPPTWRRDLSREIDLIEEIARIYGYDEIPEDARVPMAASAKTDSDRVLEKVRSVLTGVGFDEAMSASVVTEDWATAYSPWSNAQPLRNHTPMLKGADTLRPSLVPSLLESRRINQSLSNPVIELFETARVYLNQGESLPQEIRIVGVTTGEDYFYLKGVISRLLTTLKIDAVLAVESVELDLLHPSRSAKLLLDGELFGFLGEVSDKGLKQFGLRSAATVAEIKLELLEKHASLVPQHSSISTMPSIARDLNIVVDESVSWAQIESVVAQSAGTELQTVKYLETYRDPNQDGEHRKRILLNVTMRSDERTMTGEEADAIRENVVSAISEQLGGQLLG